jgi:hypothetical protein
MRGIRLLLTGLLFAGLSISCGSSTQLEGVAIHEIQLDGEHAEELKGDLEKALLAAGATLNQSGQPDLIGTVTWEWAGDRENPYPTLVRIFLQSEPPEDDLTLTARYAVAKGAQPQNVSHYKRAIVKRVVTRLAAQIPDAS